MEQTNFESVYKDVFPFWNNITKAEQEYICSNSIEKHYKKGENIHDSSECSGVIFVRSGCLRVYMMSENGKNVTLYRLHSGDMCMLSASCVLKTITFDVFIDVEEDSCCYMISGPAFMKLSDNLFKKIKNKTGIEKSTILDLASKLQDGNMKNELR